MILDSHISSTVNLSKNPRLCDLHNLGFLLRFIVLDMCPLLWIRLKFNQKVVGYHPNIHATIAPISLSCQAYHYYSLQSSELHKLRPLMTYSPQQPI